MATPMSARSIGVRISQGFEIGKCEVTPAQWEAVMRDPHAGRGARSSRGRAEVSHSPSRFKGASLPVDSVSWVDVALFLKRLNARDTDSPEEGQWAQAGGRPGTAARDDCVLKRRPRACRHAPFELEANEKIHGRTTPSVSRDPPQSARSNCSQDFEDQAAVPRRVLQTSAITLCSRRQT